MWSLGWQLSLADVLEMEWDEYLYWWNRAYPQLAARHAAQREAEAALAELKRQQGKPTKPDTIDIVELL